jgi:hypothetical protein
VLYKGFDTDFAHEMAKLCAAADVIVPNLTEACFMLDKPYIASGYSEDYVKDLLISLTDLGCKKALLTGIGFSADQLGCYGYDAEKKEFFSYFNERKAQSFHGTGDVFASVCFSECINGKDLLAAAASAADFVCEAIDETISDDRPITYGVHFEKDETNPIFSPTEDWCCGRAIDADVLAFDGKLFLYFATRDHEMKIQMQGCAYAPLGCDYARDRWTQATNAPILYPELLWEGQCIEAAATLVHNGKVYMFYGGSYNCTPQQIGYAVSSDGIHFEKPQNTPFLPAGNPGDWNACESGHPYAFVDDDGRIYLFYQGSPDGGKSWYLSRCEIGFHGDEPYIIQFFHEPEEDFQ